MLTTDMTNLCREIVGMRARRGQMQDAMARIARDRRRSMDELCKQFNSARTAMARRSKSDRVAFLAGVRRSVNAQRQAMSADLAGVRRAWAGRA